MVLILDWWGLPVGLGLAVLSSLVCVLVIMFLIF